MSIHRRILLAAGSLVGAVCAGAAPLLAFSPHFETTGKGAFDLTSDALRCRALLARQVNIGEAGGSGGESADEALPRYAMAIRYADNFARFMLESGNVVDPNGTILGPDDYPEGRARAEAEWEDLLEAYVLQGLLPEGGAPPDEIARCLRQYGHPWEEDEAEEEGARP